MVKVTQEVAIERIRVALGDGYDLSKAVYVDAKTKMTVICLKHGEFHKVPLLFWKGVGCHACSFKNRVDINQVINRFMTAHGNRYGYQLVEYRHSQKPVTIICKIHGAFRQAPSNHWKGSGCPNCAKGKTVDANKWIETLKTVHGDRFDYDHVSDLGLDEFLLSCPDHGSFFTTAQIHLASPITGGCSDCKIQQKSKGKPYGSEPKMKSGKKANHLRRFRLVHGDKYDYSKAVYKNMQTRVTIICPDHGEFKLTPVWHWKGVGCSSCNPSARVVTEQECLRRFKDKHGEKFDYSKVIFIHPTVAVTVICPSHGEFSVQPVNHWKTDYGCGTCSTEARKKKTGETVVSRFMNVHGSRYTYERFQYGHMHSLSTITCRKHGDFDMSPANHLSDHGCPSCWQNTASKPETAWGKAISDATGWALLQGRKVSGVSSVIDFIATDTPYGKLALEYDGQYWHSRPEVKARDISKTRQLIDAGFMVIRLRAEEGRSESLPSVPGAINVYVPASPDEESLNLAVKQMVFALEELSR